MGPRLRAALYAATALLLCKYFYVGSSPAHHRDGGVEPVHQESIAGMLVHWQRPLKNREPRGMLFLFHGCSHSGSDFFVDCEECLGLPEEGIVVREARSHHNSLLVVALSSSDREMSRCWRHEDLFPTQKVISELREKFNMQSRPLFAIGASSGGSFVALLASEYQSLSAISVQIMSPGVLGDLSTGVEFVTMPRDSYTEELVLDTFGRMKKLGHRVSKRTCDPTPFTPNFLRDRTALARYPISTRLSSDIYKVLTTKGFIDPTTGLLEDDPRETDWREALVHSDIEGIAEVRMEPDESALSETMNVAWAMHEICSTSIQLTFHFFWGGL
mmetsp:Transcript_45624/g.103014  ORF Transcript_45624/g.103014 Transcript_45624/m.103014 type:complete len:330 (-) Transcript_45624:29-1018(-)|eukprot:CAMPEP_0172609338 /NCGR_PEP_ID=MMETSP1068-20121228/29347_1 /TAXON_ID=35684 /ORGANISM="Pseudopedinella elastica, Strain CCMP716" /LENGTH=329 /DNA_ID=CAMNT_0013412833 /DNA_START=202 /DNA_END=1191 /DNA_ORIENTATION=+